MYEKIYPRGTVNFIKIAEKDPIEKGRTFQVENFRNFDFKLCY